MHPKKQGLSAPDSSWFRGESIDCINQMLRNPRAIISEFPDRGCVQDMLDSHSAGKINHQLRIWSPLRFEWQLKKFIV